MHQFILGHFRPLFLLKDAQNLPSQWYKRRKVIWRKFLLWYWCVPIVGKLEGFYIAFLSVHLFVLSANSMKNAHNVFDHRSHFVDNSKWRLTIDKLLSRVFKKTSDNISRGRPDPLWVNLLLHFRAPLTLRRDAIKVLRKKYISESLIHSVLHPQFLRQQSLLFSPRLDLFCRISSKIFTWSCLNNKSESKRKVNYGTISCQIKPVFMEV